MSMKELKYRRFTISPVDGGWAWSVRDPQGRETASGFTVERAFAAALVLREIARAVLPVEVAEVA